MELLSALYILLILPRSIIAEGLGNNTGFTVGLTLGNEGNRYDGQLIDIGAELFNSFFHQGHNNYHIVKRECSSCTIEGSKLIYYKRLTHLDTFNAYSVMINWDDNVNGLPNVLETDFNLYSTLQDALNNNNPWCCCNYGGTGAFRDCGPNSQNGHWTGYNSGHPSRFSVYGVFTLKPTKSPSKEPSHLPTSITVNPTKSPSKSPSPSSTSTPTSPTAIPTSSPTKYPTSIIFSSQPIISKNSKQCIGIDIHTDLYLYGCQNEQLHVWTMDSLGWIMHDNKPGLCLQVDVVFPKLSTCDGGHNQIWEINSNNQITNGGNCLIHGNVSPLSRLSVESCGINDIWNIGTFSPTKHPTIFLTNNPTSSMPSITPTAYPSIIPSIYPTITPTIAITVQPTKTPTLDGVVGTQITESSKNENEQLHTKNKNKVLNEGGIAGIVITFLLLITVLIVGWFYWKKKKNNKLNNTKQMHTAEVAMSTSNVMIDGESNNNIVHNFSSDDEVITAGGITQEIDVLIEPTGDGDVTGQETDMLVMDEQVVTAGNNANDGNEFVVEDDTNMITAGNTNDDEQMLEKFITVGGDENDHIKSDEFIVENDNEITPGNMNISEGN